MPTDPHALSAEQMQALHTAHHQSRKVRRAAGIATFSGWTLVTFAVITLISGLFSLPALLLGIGMVVVARNELRGAKDLRRLDRTAPRRLGLNQLALGGMLLIYGGWGIFAALTAPGRYDEQIAQHGAQVAEMLEPLDSLHRLVSVTVYVLVIVGGGLSTGSTCLYYFTRRRHVDAQLRQSPEWVVETLRAVA